MSERRAMEARLRAWKTFRDVAHATRTLASAQVLRWTGARRRAAVHFDRCQAMVWRMGAALPHDAPLGIVAFGTDLGLCGPFNRTVQQVLLDHPRLDDAELVVVVGHRLQQRLDEKTTWVRESAPSSPDRALELALRIELLARRRLGSAARLVLIHATEARGDGTAEVGVDEGPPAGTSVGHAGIPALSQPDLVHQAALDLLQHARLIRAATHSGWAEASVRTVRMTRAHDVAADRIEEQELTLNKLRQDEITTEMLEARAGRGKRSPAKVRHVSEVG